MGGDSNESVIDVWNETVGGIKMKTTGKSSLILEMRRPGYLSRRSLSRQAERKRDHGKGMEESHRIRG